MRKLGWAKLRPKQQVSTVGEVQRGGKAVYVDVNHQVISQLKLKTK